MNKDCLRQKLKAIRQGLFTESEKAAKDALAATDLFLSYFSPYFSQHPNQIIAVYSPIQSEFNINPLVEALKELSQKIALPRITHENTLSFALWEDASSLEAQDFGILAPSLERQEVFPDLFLIPLLGFGRQGHRLGYGKGHYDKMLAKVRKMKDILAIGVGFSQQEIFIPFHEPHDEVLDFVLTEKELIRCR